MANADNASDNKIICREIPNSRTVRNFIQKRLREWIRVHGLDETSAHYQVILNREGGGHHFSCQIEVEGTSNAHMERWSGSWADNGLHQTLLKTLNHMIRGPVLATV